MRRLYVRFIWWLAKLDQILAISRFSKWDRIFIPHWLYTLAQNEWYHQGCDNCVTHHYRECHWPKGECAGFMSMFEKHEQVKRL